MASILFVINAALVLYVLGGYPLILAFMARKRSKPIRRGERLKTVSVLLPVRNGEAWLKQKLQSILALDYPRELMQIMVVSDGSTDGTEACAREFASQGVEFLQVPPVGKAVALNTLISHAWGEILFFTDVRQTLAADALRNLVRCFDDPDVGVASGELFIGTGRDREEASVGLYWRYEKWIRKNLSRIDSLLGATGSIYAMRRELAVPLPPGTLLDDMQLPLHAFFQGYRVIMEDSARAYDIPAALGTEFRRKVRTLAGVYQVLQQFPALLTPSNRMMFHFVSHKLGRQFLPFFLLTLAITSFFLPAPFALGALWAQAGFYGLAALDPFLPDRFALKRVSSPVRTFVVLMGAALCSVSIFFRPATAFWVPTRSVPTRS